MSRFSDSRKENKIKNIAQREECKDKEALSQFPIQVKKLDQVRLWQAANDFQPNQFHRVIAVDIKIKNAFICIPLEINVINKCIRSVLE